MSKEKIEKPISTFGELDAALKPFVSKVTEAKKRIENLQKGLGEYEAKYIVIEKKLTGLLVESEAALGETGKVKFSDSIFANRQEKEDLSVWIDRIKSESIPQAQAELKIAEKELSEKFVEGVTLLRGVYIERIKKIYDQTNVIWNGFVVEAGGVLKEFGFVLSLYDLDMIYMRPRMLQ